jgi:hypothetical protein
MRILRTLLACGSAAVLTGGLTLTAGATSGLAATRGPATAHPAHHLSARYLAEARAALVKYLGGHPLAERIQPGLRHRGSANTAGMDSYNWSGYVDQATNVRPAFSRVSGSWAQPAVTCTNEDTITSEWVGLDGWSTQTVEQAGTVGWCFLGTATYYSWWEMFPSNSIQVGSSVQPGDAISASVSRSGPATYTLSVADATHPANSFSQNASCATACQDASAEWIAERPAFSIGIAPLADYGTWTLTNAQETYRGVPGNISSYPNYFPVDMQDATQTYSLSTPGALSGGNSFTTTWLNSY